MAGTGAMKGAAAFWKRNGTAYAFLLPWFGGMLLLSIVPMLASFFLSLTSYDLFSAPEWVGLRNYADMVFHDKRLVRSALVTLTYVFGSVPPVIVLSLGLAISLNKGLPGLPVFRAVYYTPSLLGGSVAIAVLWRQVFGKEGLVNQILALFGVEGVSWIASPKYAILPLIILHVWQFGSPMVIFLAALRQIPVELYESVEIDGGGRVRKFLFITLPLLSPIIFFNVTMQIISSLKAFTGAYVVSGGTGGPLDSTLFYTLYLYQKGFGQFHMGYASAMAWVLVGVIAVFTVGIFATAKWWVYYED